MTEKRALQLLKPSYVTSNGFMSIDPNIKYENGLIKINGLITLNELKAVIKMVETTQQRNKNED